MVLEYERMEMTLNNQVINLLFINKYYKNNLNNNSIYVHFHGYNYYKSYHYNESFLFKVLVSTVYNLQLSKRLK